LDRAGHFAVQISGGACRAAPAPLYCGRVLAGGGVSRHNGGYSDPESTAELYDPSARPTLNVARISPLSGSYSGGTSVTVEGTGLFQVRAVQLASTSASITYQSDRRIRLSTPSHAPARVDVTVTTARDPRPASIAHFTYVSGSWEATAALDSCTVGSSAGQSCPGRYGHTATLLDGPACRAGSPPGYCGKVLVAGGTNDLYNGSAPSASAALYDPASASWASTGSLAGRGRYFHTATLLDGPECHGTLPLPHCGKVLLVGGSEARTPFQGGFGWLGLETAELYDPAAGTFSSTGSLSEGRFHHTATLLDGTPAQCKSNCGRVLVAGGVLSSMSHYRNSVEIYDPMQGTWSITASMGTARALHSATLLPTGEVLVAGGLGLDASGSSALSSRTLTSSELYNPASQAWSVTGLLAIPRFAHTATDVDSERCGAPCGSVVAVGGVTQFSNKDDFGAHSQGSATFTSSTEIFDRAAHCTVPDAAGHAVPVTGCWSGGPPLNEVRGGHTATRLGDGRLLVAGGGFPFDLEGYAYQTPQSSEILESPANSSAVWRYTSALRAPRGLHTATLLTGPRCGVNCGKVLAVGGFGPEDEAPDASIAISPPALASAELYRVPPTVTSISPSSGGSAGGTSVLITGANLLGAKAVSFGGVPAQSFTAHSATMMTAVSPPHPKGEVEVAVTDVAGGTSASYLPNRGAVFSYDGCGEAAAAGQLVYPSGYSLVGDPGGTVVGAQSLLYSWFDRNSGSYSSQDPTIPVEPGHGYWAYFSCKRAVSIGLGGASASFPLGAYHASMVGNPSGTSPATVTGHDFAARWDPSLNGGSGGYQISAYRQPQDLAVGEGTWVFSYVDSTVAIHAPG